MMYTRQLASWENVTTATDFLTNVPVESEKVC